jgi:hypothetical protein
VNRFQKLSSAMILLLAFIYPPSIATAQVSSQGKQDVEAETNLVGELLLAQRYNVRRNRCRLRHNARRNRYERWHNVRQNYCGRRHNVRQNRYGRWQLAPDRHGRMLFELRRH